MVKGPRTYSCEFGARRFKNKCVVAITIFFSRQSGLRNTTKFQVVRKRAQLPPRYACQRYNITVGTYDTFEVRGTFLDAFSSKLVIVENA